MVTMNDIARGAGVSRYTVSKVLNKTPGVSERLAGKVLRVCEELGYVRNLSAVNLVRRGSRTVGLIVSQITDPFFGEIIQAAEKASSQAGYDLVFRCSYEDPRVEAEVIAHFQALMVRGLVIAPVVSSQNHGLIERLSARIPVIHIDRYFTRECNFVVNDNLDSARQVTEHLITQRSSPHYLASVHSLLNRAVRDRQEGYERAMRSHGLTPVVLAPDRVADGEDIDNERCGCERMRRHLKDNPPPDALFCATDSLALGAMRALVEHGLVIGRDVLLAGHDDLAFGAYLKPSLTTVAQPKAGIGETAIKNLLGFMDAAEPSGSFARKTLKSRLIIRESSRRGEA